MTARIIRVPWGNFPAVIANDQMGSLRWDAKDIEAPEYHAAKKEENWQAALGLIQRKLKPDTLARIDNFLHLHCTDFSKLEIIPIDAIESAGNNKIPLAIAKIVSDYLGGVQINTDIKQANKVGRTGAGINHRLAFMPMFDGYVRDKQYFIVDDTLRVGGTIANLRGFLDLNGGKTIGAFVMQSDEQSLILQPSEKTYRKLYAKHGKEVSDDFCRKQFGFDTQCLTRGEAGNIAAAASLADIEQRIADAREQHRRNKLEIISITEACQVAESQLAIAEREIARIARTRGQTLDTRGIGEDAEGFAGIAGDLTVSSSQSFGELAELFGAAAKSGAVELDMAVRLHPELTGAMAARSRIAQDTKFSPDWGPDRKERLQLATDEICTAIREGTLHFDDNAIERFKTLAIKNQQDLDNER